MPTQGASAGAGWVSLIQTVPERSALAVRKAFLMSLVQMAAARPNSLSFDARDDLVDRVERGHRHDRAEDLFAGDALVVATSEKIAGGTK